jgi:predicted nucleotidyltransferase
MKTISIRFRDRPRSQRSDMEKDALKGLKMMKKLTIKERHALNTFKNHVSSLLGPDLQQTILFGSKARGDGRATSDFDLAVIVRHVTHQMKRNVIDIACNRYLEDDVDISPVVYTAEEYEKYRLAGNPFIKNIDKDKIIL